MEASDSRDSQGWPVKRVQFLPGSLTLGTLTLETATIFDVRTQPGRKNTDRNQGSRQWAGIGVSGLSDDSSSRLWTFQLRPQTWWIRDKASLCCLGQISDPHNLSMTSGCLMLLSSRAICYTATDRDHYHRYFSHLEKSFLQQGECKTCRL